jgi:hypothetical protein
MPSANFIEIESDPRLDADHPENGVLIPCRNTGLLDSLDHRMLDFFGDRSLAEVDDKKNAITVQNLLDMTSGIDWSEPLNGRPDSLIEMRRSPDWIKFILDRPMLNAPGDTFNYNSGNSQLLSAIITKLTGMDAQDYAVGRRCSFAGSQSGWHSLRQTQPACALWQERDSCRRSSDAKART